MNPGLEKKTKKSKLLKRNKTKKQKQEILLLSHRTPKKIVEISEDINREIGNSQVINSYSPSINKKLVSLKSVQRKELFNCNNERAFLLEAPLKIGVPDKSGKKICYPYDDPVAKKYMLKNLKANKHANPNKIVPPIQELANCWFNTMFVSLFISDKGRKFFHFLRQMMIDGKQKGGNPIPEVLRDGFALFNYAIDACLTGNKYAYILNTNAIIQQIYDSVPADYKEKYYYIRDVDEAGNPIRYYLCLIDYLGNRSLPVLFVKDCGPNWQFQIQSKIVGKLPNVIILEFFNDDEPTTNKETSFTLNGAKYSLDSCIIRDTEKNHFSSLLTCEKKEMAYDGMSFHRLTYMDWKDKINTDFKWQFKGSKDEGRLLTWNFTKGYYMLIYYRV
jgi:hypothetical protein